MPFFILLHPRSSFAGGFPFFSISQMTSDVIVAKVGARIISPIVKLLLLIDVVPAVVAQVSPSRMWDRVALVLLPHEAP